MSSDRMWWCALCQSEEGHCFGKGFSVTQAAESSELIGCGCECKTHTISDDDIRQDLIVIMGLEANDDYSVLKEFITTLPEERARAVLMLMTKYVMWMVREAGFDAVEMVQKTALYWAGGEPD